MTRFTTRVRALCDLDAAFLREYSGLHDEYDGQIIDLSPTGVRSHLLSLGGDRLDDPKDEAQVAATENAMRVRFGVIEQHRRDPWVHLEALDLSQYDRPYAPEADRRRARDNHLRAWGQLVDNAIASLDLVHPAVAAGFVPAVRGLAATMPADAVAAVGGETVRATATRLVQHLETLAAAPPADHHLLGAERLGALLGCEDLIEVDPDALLAIADAESERMSEILADALDRLEDQIGSPVLARLREGHGSFDDVIERTQQAVAAAAGFVAERDLVPYVDDQCLVAPSPPARRGGVARVSWRAPWETCGHSYFHISPPAPEWSTQEQRDWLARFHDAALPVLAVHEVAPGHCSHALAMAHADSAVRRTFWSELFFEGWAHYAEEMCWEEGFADQDARYQAGMAMDALLRVARVRVAVGLHSGALGLTEAIELMAREGHIAGPMARAEAVRGLWEPSYARYTLGKVLVRGIRDQARHAWGSAFTVQRFHRELLGHGSPPVGLVAGWLGLAGGDGL